MSRISRWSIAVAAAVAFAAPLSAQQVPAGDAASAPATASMEATVPVLAFAPVTAFDWGTATELSTAAATAPVPPAMGRRQSVALMVVGGAGLVVGSLINGDTGTIIMVGGAVVGLFGLFQYLR